MTQILSFKLKKLIYQSKYRGCKESELILKKFIENYLDKLTAEEIDDFEFFLGYNDAKILDWIIYNKQPPEEVKNNKIFTLIKNFTNKDDK